jgi:hypothetical protein
LDKIQSTLINRREMEMETIKGQCHCGYIKYEAQGPVVKCSYCDCRGCQKATGTFKAPFVTVLREGFRIIGAEPTKFRAESGDRCDAHGTWNFCPKCGTQIFWKGNQGNELDLFAGTLDNMSLFRVEEDKEN